VQWLIRRISGQIEDEIHHFAARENSAARFDTSRRHHGGGGLDLAEAWQGGLR
jgi:hypothetical protein